MKVLVLSNSCFPDRYGKQAMTEIETIAKELSFSKIELHVFGHNKVAQNLYEKLDYEVTNIIMAKKLS